MSKVKNTVLTFLICVLICAGLGFSNFQINYQYRAKIGCYLRLADDASTAPQKLQYLRQYVDAVARYIPDDADAALFYKTARTSAKVQKGILNTLLQRVEQVAAMNPMSLEYQQAMAQVTGQEFAGTLDETNALLWDAYVKQCGLLYYLHADGVLTTAAIILSIFTVIVVFLVEIA